MEDGLGEQQKKEQKRHLVEVLILVLVEDGLGDHLQPFQSDGLCARLNPCFSGGWSRRKRTETLNSTMHRLNPCFSGGWSRRAKYQRQYESITRVLILVLVEDGLGDYI